MIEALIAGQRDPQVLAIIWHLLASRTARFCDLGAGYYASRTDKAKKARNHIRQPEALGFTVTLAPAA
jgi:transposase